MPRIPVSATNLLASLAVFLASAALSGCGSDGGTLQAQAAESCMLCHNASLKNDYSGPGIENPHPFPGASKIRCTTCHGGNPNGADMLASHVPPPPEIGDDQKLVGDAKAYFNRLTLVGMDKFPPYVADGKTYVALDYLQFVNPGDLRVVTQGRACGQWHSNHAEGVAGNLLATQTGIFGGAAYAIGLDNAIPANQGLYEDTASDYAFRAVADPVYDPAKAAIGAVASLVETPVHSVFGKIGPTDIFQNPLYNAAALAGDLWPDHRVKTGSPLAHLFMEQVAFTCGDCHLGSAGANNRYADFRSSGCSACHMPYSPSGRSGSSDPNIDKFEPVDPDDIDAPERSHPRSHRILSVHKTLADGTELPGIDDYACVDCHQGSNRTVLQYWGIRLDQNADLKNGVQYPANPATYVNTKNDLRLFDPAVGNKTFNGRNANQYILFEDYDGDGRDDTPEDVHYEAGLGCIDCHGSYDLHGGDVASGETEVLSRMEQRVAIRCESCHGGIEAYAATQTGTAFDGTPSELAVDAKGNLLDHVRKESDGSYYLYSRLDGAKHYVPQTLDTVADGGTLHPFTQAPVYSSLASYAMGRADGTLANGIGPQQTKGVTPGFSHTDNMDCASCHASWTNTCQGCHLKGEYDTGNNFSNVSGERIVYRQTNADFTYQSPVFFELGVSASNKVTVLSANTKVFYQYRDLNQNFSKVFTFSDRNGSGSNPAKAAFPSLSHNAIMPHSIRGKVEAVNEGPRYCVSCHLTESSLANHGAAYSAFRSAMAAGDFGALDYPTLRSHIGQNPGNQIDSPLFVHMAAGLGSGLMTFDENGCPVNPLDGNANRVGCNGVAPASNYDPARVRLDLDRIVEPTGTSNGSSNHVLFAPGQGPNLRDGATDPNLTGPLGATILRKLTDPATGVVLDSWIDADGTARGDAPNYLGAP